MAAGGRSAFSFCLVPWALAVGLTGGCRNCELVEAELRTRERELREAREALHRAEWNNQALLHEIGGLRQGAAYPPEIASQTSTVRHITLGFTTGGSDEDKVPGDEALRVVVEPRDGDGHVIKAPGVVHVEALEISPAGLKTPLSYWDISSRQLRQTWQNGLLVNGYVLVLPWKAWPTMGRLRVVARLRLSDGRLFEADKDVCIRLAHPGKEVPSLTVATDDGSPAFPEEEDQALPYPRKVKPDAQEGKRESAPYGRGLGEGIVPAGYREEAPTSNLALSVRLLTPVPADN
jgi:hypothetical protein